MPPTKPRICSQATDSEPRCDECGVVLSRYGPALDTGKDGWMCPECGWSWDDEEDC
jgi:predicted RNA-binding Zn-ribbon protein involved in translation (DUF1610 family)